jgi:outer membrane protein assembly factor BamB
MTEGRLCVIAAAGYIDREAGGRRFLWCLPLYCRRVLIQPMRAGSDCVSLKSIFCCCVRLGASSTGNREADSPAKARTFGRRSPPDGLGTNRLLVMGIVSSLAAWGVASDRWQQFRGPDSDGISRTTQLPVRWNETENVTWFSPLEGLGWSSPVVHQGRVYLTQAVPLEDASDRQLLQLVCLQATDGQVLFVRDIFPEREGSPAIHKKNSHASPTPVVAGDRVLVHFGHQGTAAVSLDGELLWVNRDHFYPPQHGNGGSPILVGDRLVVTCDGSDNPYTLALDVATGRMLWQTYRGVETMKKFSFCTPLLIDVEGQPQIISPGSDIVQALRPEDGSVIWSLRYTGFSVVPQPLFQAGRVYLSTGFMDANLLCIDPSGQGDVTDTHLLWRYTRNGPHTPTPVIHEQTLIMISDTGGVLTGLDTVTGEPRWRKRIGGNFSASPLLAGDRLYLQDEDGRGLILQLDGGNEPVELATNMLPGRTFASYAVIGSSLLIRTERGLFRID